MLLKQVFTRFIQIGTLKVTDSQGNSYVFSGKPGPKAAIRFRNKSIEWKLLLNADIATGEGYVDGDIIIEEGTLYDFLDICTQNLALNQFGWLNRVVEACMRPFRYLYQYNPLSTAKSHIAHHYDLDAKLYKLFLDSDLQYSCAYFTEADQSLEVAQENKKRHLAAKLRLQPGQKVLDIGSGWGGLALYLAGLENIEVTGLTLSKEQLAVSTERAKQAGLSDRVKFYLRDYREEQQRYDRIVSVGMFEHVGVPYYQKFFDHLRELLTEEGLAVIHAIGRSTPPEYRQGWINKYIFPGGYSPALSEELIPIEKSRLFVTDIEILRYHYAKTLQFWFTRFYQNRDIVKALYDERFCRIWEYYLISSEVAFRNLGYYVSQIQLVRDPSISTATRDYINEWEQQELKQKHSKVTS
jgi:cyclopropane-fatty-acyl-phospholipid synthase